MFFVRRDHRFRVVEGGGRVGEIDAVLRDVRFFFLGIPFKSHRFFTLTEYGTTSIQNCNIIVRVTFAVNFGAPRTRTFQTTGTTVAGTTSAGSISTLSVISLRRNGMSRTSTTPTARLPAPSSAKSFI